MHARAGGHGRVGGRQEREGFSPLVVHRGGHGLLRAATSAFSTPCRWRVHTEALIPFRGEWAGPLEEIQYTTTASLKNFWPGKGNTCEWPLRTRQRPLCRRRRSSCRSRWPCGACRRSRCTRHLWQHEPRRLCLPAFSRHCLPSCRSASPIVHRLLMLPKSSLQSKQPNRHLLSRKTPVWS